MLTRDELEALVELFAAYMNKVTPSKIAEAKAVLAFHRRKLAGSTPLGDEPLIVDVLRAFGELGKRLVHDKEADVGVVLSKVFGEISDVVRRAAAQIRPAPEAPTTTKDVAQPHLLTLQIFRRNGHGEDMHERTESFGPGVIKIGRLDSSRLKLDDALVNRMHAVIEFEPDGRVHIIDLGSTAGTMVNGVKINKAELKDGYVVKLADTTLGVSLR